MQKSPHVFDNFFWSVKPAEHLLKDSIYSWEQPEETGKTFLKNSWQQKKVKAFQQGKSIFCPRNSLVVTAWKNKKVGSFLWIQCNPGENNTVNHEQPHWGQERLIMMMINHKQHDSTVIQVQSVPVVKVLQWKHEWCGSSQSQGCI